MRANPGGHRLDNFLGFDLTRSSMGAGFSMARHWFEAFQPPGSNPWADFIESTGSAMDRCMGATGACLVDSLETFRQRRAGEAEFLELFSDPFPGQELTAAAPGSLMIETPSLRLWDLSTGERHEIDNYTVVFAPRAGHHSNIAERAALFLRNCGLSRMAIVEQKCADEIPLYVGGKRHREDFEGQVAQYRQVLAHLKDCTGRPPHLVAVCQPGPLLMATLILYPELGRTVGIADYPSSVPIWALGGEKDDIAPPLQATGHVDLIGSVAPEDKLSLICPAGHMGLFRSDRVLEKYYTRIARFLLDRSDIAP